MRLSLVIALLVFAVSASTYAGQRFVVSSYNIENLFDVEDDPGKDDAEFLPGGKAGWSREKLELKLMQAAAAIKAVNDGQGPDIVALPEVENLNVLTMLNKKLKGMGYQAVLIEGNDERGIDVGLLTRFPLVGKPVAVPVEDMNDPLWRRPTRPIVEVIVKVAPNVRMGLLLNHWPSRAGVEALRCRAGEVARSIIVERQRKNPDLEYVVMGDLNDEPENGSIKNCLGAGTAEQALESTVSNPKFFNAYLEKNLSKDQRGTYYYGKQKAWNALDHIIMTKGLINGRAIRYVEGSFTQVRNKLNVLPKPFKTQKGYTVPAGAPVPFTVIADGGKPQVIGISDHLPIRATFEVVDARGEVGDSGKYPTE